MENITLRKVFYKLLVMIFLISTVSLKLNVLPVSTLLADESGGAVDLDSRNSVIQSNGVDWWPMFHHDQHHTGYSTSTAPNTNHVRWTFETGSLIHASPAVADGKVYVGSFDSMLYCLDASTGELIWSHQTYSSESSPAIFDGKVYVGSFYDKIICLDAEGNGDGTTDEIWNYPTTSSVDPSPTVAYGKVYVASLDGNVYCLDAYTGDYIWSYPTGSLVREAPSVAYGQVYVGSLDTGVHCLDASTGGFIWNFPVSWVQTSPAVAYGQVYVGSDNGYVYCLDAYTGDYVWSKLTGGWVQSSPAVAYGKVYVGSFDNNVFCLDAYTGDYVWSKLTGGWVRSSPAVADGKVYVGSDDMQLYCLDASTGDYIWSYPMGGSPMSGNYVFSSPAVADDRVYIGSEEGIVYAFQDINIADLCVVSIDDWIVANYRIDDTPPRIRTRTFDGSRWQTLPTPITEPRTAPFNPSITVNPEPVLHTPLLTMATTVNPEPVLNNPNIVIRQFNGTDWTGPTLLPDTVYGSNPAVASLPSSDELFLFWENTNRTPTHAIGLSIYNQTDWSTSGYFIGEGETPTATFYNDEIYVLWAKDDGLAYRVYNHTNESWSEERGQMSPFLIDPQPTLYDPLIAVHDGLLYLVYESQSVYLHTFNGTGWSNSYALQNYGTLSPSRPAITSFDEKLNIVYISEGELYRQTLEGELDTGDWSPPTKIPTHSLSTDWWPMFHHDLNNTGHSTSVAPSTDNILWNYATGESTMSSPAVYDCKIYIGSSDDRVYCLDALTGTQIWNYTTGYDVFFSSPAVADNKVYVGSGSRIYCLDALTGAHVWNYTTGAGVFSSPVVSDGRVYAGSIDNKVYCLNASTGDFIWSYTTSDDVYSSPSLTNGNVYIGSDDSSIYCLNATSGDYIWSYITGGGVRSSPSVVEGRVYVGSTDNKIYCLNALTGAYIWDYTTSDRVHYSSPAVVDGKIFVGSEDRKVYCLNATIGAHIWNYTTGDMIWSSPAVADGKVYVGSNDGRVYCLDVTTGEHIWNYTTKGYVVSSPAIAAGTVFIGSRDSRVYAFGSSNIHDTAITQITPSKEVVCQDHSMHISVTLENQGPYAGSFTVTTHYSNQSIETRTIANLQSEEETTVTFTWNTTGADKGNYTLSATVHPVPGETSINDNYFIDSWVIVAMVGDITGPDGWPDSKCDMRDVGLVARYFGQNAPPAPVNCDLTGPTSGVPDGSIDMRDIGLVARHFGETDP
jgi:outer membrane protein assembly factor BamB